MYIFTNVGGTLLSSTGMKTKVNENIKVSCVGSPGSTDTAFTPARVNKPCLIASLFIQRFYYDRFCQLIGIRERKCQVN